MNEPIPCEHAVWIGDTSMGTDMCPHEADRFLLFHRTGEVAATCTAGVEQHATGWEGSGLETPISREEFIVLQVLGR